MWILIDNYDSFTHILHHYLLQCGAACKVFRNDELTIAELKALNPERLILSPGPETPIQSGICIEAIAEFHDKIPILGICLGHQAIGMFFGATLLTLPYPMHGKTSQISYKKHFLFEGLSQPFIAMRYHSLAIETSQSPELLTLAYSLDDQVTMAIGHKKYPCIGLQFHPESIGTSQGIHIIQNWAKAY